ncbi:MAG: hypothetical protein AB7H66_17095 [Hyphomonadaceae bacterium]
MITERDRRHAELPAGFFSQIAVALIAGVFIQIFLPEFGSSSSVAVMLVTGIFFYGAAHVILDVVYRTPP